MGCIFLPGCSLPIPGLAYFELILGITENRDVLIKFLSRKTLFAFPSFWEKMALSLFFKLFFTYVTTLFLVRPERESLLNLLVFSLAATGSLVDVVGISWFKFKNHRLRTVLCFDAITCLVENTLWVWPLSVFEPRIVTRLIRESFEPRIDWLENCFNGESFLIWELCESRIVWIVNGFWMEGWDSQRLTSLDRKRSLEEKPLKLWLCLQGGREGGAAPPSAPTLFRLQGLQVQPAEWHPGRGEGEWGRDGGTLAPIGRLTGGPDCCWFCRDRKSVV